MPQPVSQPKPDLQTFVTVFHTDPAGTVPAVFNPHASLAEVAQALCDIEVAGCPLVKIIEANPVEGWSRDVTEDVAREILKLGKTIKDGWECRPCAIALLAQFDLDESEDEDADGESMEIGWDCVLDRHAMEVL